MWGKKVKASHKLWNKNTSQDYVTKTWCKNTSQYVMYFYLTRLVWVIFTSQLMQVWCIFTSRLVWGIFTSHDSSEVFLPHALSGVFLPHELCEIILLHELSEVYFTSWLAWDIFTSRLVWDILSPRFMCRRLKYLTSWEASLGAVPKGTSRQKRKRNYSTWSNLLNFFKRMWFYES